jgi:hypothetical protein
MTAIAALAGCWKKIFQYLRRKIESQRRSFATKIRCTQFVILFRLPLRNRATFSAAC